jgi:hypothetical protein
MRAIADRYRGYLPVALRGKAVDAPQRTFQPLSIQQQANASHGITEHGVPLWSSKGEMNLADLPSGRQLFQDVPFDVLDAVQHPHGSCIVLSQQTPYASSVSIRVDAKASSLYLLNAADGRATGMILTMHYSDGSSHSEDVAPRSWIFPSDSNMTRLGRALKTSIASHGRRALRPEKRPASTQPESTIPIPSERSARWS